ncbi:hypothetical protein HDU79_002236 [Rhizoclosmatium sp. JEL0117]|nr:hypothetical protein HDU79_002236 [Rhizoclosmatium sp. JEL0117]
MSILTLSTSLITLAATITLAQPYIPTLSTSLFSWHPVLMALFFWSTITASILLKQKSPSTLLYHALLQVVAVVAITAGFVVEYYNKDLNKRAHFTSWHGVLGGTATLLCLAVALFGDAVYWFPKAVFGSLVKARKWYEVKKYAGTFATLISVIAGVIGVNAYASVDQNVKLGISGVLTLTTLLLVVIPSSVPAKKVKNDKDN